MTNEELETSLKNQLLELFKNNSIFRDNLNFLTQVQLRMLPENITLKILGKAEEMYRYELSREFTPPQMKVYIS